MNTDEVVRGMERVAAKLDLKNHYADGNIVQVGAVTIKILQSELAQVKAERDAAVDGLNKMRDGNLCASCGAECTGRDRDPSIAASVCLWWENRFSGLEGQ